MTASNRWVMDDDGYARSPAVCIDASGRNHIVWISSKENEECVKHAVLGSDGHWSEPKPCTPKATHISGVAVATFRDGAVLLWIDGGVQSVSGLKLTLINNHSVGDYRIVMDGSSKPAYPEISSDGTHLFVFVTVEESAGRVLKFAHGTELDHLSNWQAVSDDRAKALYPRAAAHDGQCAVVWQEMKGRSNRLWHHLIDVSGTRFDKTLLALDDAAVSAMPTVCKAEDGWWTAWHSDRDPLEGPTLVRSIEVAKILDGGSVWVPKTAAPGVPRFGHDEDQGFEFPQILDIDGNLVVVGRSSQRLRRQDLLPTGWTTHAPIDEPGWSCRGMRPAVVRCEKGILVASREQSGVVVRLLPRSPGRVSARTDLVSRVPLRSLRETVPPEKRRLLLSGYRVLFGDIHQHTARSDGTGTLEEAYQRARIRYGDDVVAVSDHESFLGKRTPNGEWMEYCRITDEFYEPKRFVTLEAYEWTGKMHPGPGHKVVYVPPAGGSLFSRDDERTRTSEGLLKACNKQGAVVVPHHVGWTGADMAHHLSDVQTCFEIVSCHGAYEKSGFPIITTRGDDKDGQFICDALDRNLRFGLTGGSDGHGLSWHHGVSRVQDSHRTGLTGFLCKDVTREGVFEALKKRRCYATSGAKIGVWFEVDGRPMGEELMAGRPVPFRVVVNATSTISDLCLVTNNQEELPLDYGDNAADVHGTLPPPPKNGFAYYFVRVIQDDNQVAWSSPIWLDPLASA